MPDNNKDKGKKKPFNKDNFKKGIAFVESANGKFLWNKTSSATGRYQFLYNDIKHLPELKGLSREQFRDNFTKQEEIMDLAIAGKIKNRPGYYRNAKDITEEYSELLGNKWNFRGDEVAAISHFLGRKGARDYFKSLHRGSEYKVAGKTNATVEEYLDRYNKGAGTKRGYGQGEKPMVQTKQVQPRTIPSLNNEFFSKAAPLQVKGLDAIQPTKQIQEQPNIQNIEGFQIQSLEGPNQFQNGGTLSEFPVNNVDPPTKNNNIEGARQFVRNWFNHPVTRDRLAQSLRDPIESSNLIRRGLVGIGDAKTQVHPERETATKGIYGQGKIDFIGEPSPETAAHEFTHASGIDKILSKQIRDKYGNPTANAVKLGRKDNPNLSHDEALRARLGITGDNIFAKDKLRENKKFMQYLNRQGELYPRFIEMRRFLNVSPGQKINDEQIKSLQDNSKVNQLFKYYEPDTVKEILNTIAEHDNIQNNYANVAANGGKLSRSGNCKCGCPGKPPCPDTVKEFTKDYIKSPKYKERLSSSGYKDVDGEIQKRYDNVNNATLERISGEMRPVDEFILKMTDNEGIIDEINHSYKTRYSSLDNKVHINNKEIGGYIEDPNAIIAHEMSHSELNKLRGTGTLKFGKYGLNLNGNDFNELLHRNNYFKNGKRLSKSNIKAGILPHNVDPSESKADLNGLRYILKKEGIYDAGTENFTKEHLEKLKKIQNSHTKDRMLEKYSEEDLIYLMNNIAAKSNVNVNANVAAYGGYLNSFQNGGNLNNCKCGCPGKPPCKQPISTNNPTQKEIEGINAFINKQPYISEVDISNIQGETANNLTNLTFNLADYFGDPLGVVPGTLNPNRKPSQYKPSMSKNKNAKYYTYKGLRNDIIENLTGENRVDFINKDQDRLKKLYGDSYSEKLGLSKDFKYNSDFNTIHDFYKNVHNNFKESDSGSAINLGHYRVTSGEDKKGKFISIHDTYDWDFFGGLAPKGWEIYDRIYEDEFKKLQKNLKSKKNKK